VRFIVDKVALGQVFLAVLLLPPVSGVAPVLLHTHVHRNAAVIRWLSRQSMGTFDQSSALSNITEDWTVNYFPIARRFCILCEVCALGEETVFINEGVYCQV
jgi:hypothetical protein